MGYEAVRAHATVELRPALLHAPGARAAALDVLRLRLCGTARHDERVRVLLAIPDGPEFEVDDEARVGDSLHGPGTVLVRARFDVLAHTLERGDEFVARLDAAFVRLEVGGGDAVWVAPARRGAWAVHVTHPSRDGDAGPRAAAGDEVLVRCDETFVDRSTATATAVGTLVRDARAQS